MKDIVRIAMTAAGLVGATPALARPCTAASAVGIWSLVSIRAAEPGVEDFYAKVPHEVMRFTTASGFMYLASSVLIGPAEAGQKLDAADARDGTSYRYAVAPTGSMMILRQGTPFQAFRCDIADRAQGDARPGDMILTNAPGSAMLRRVQRKIK